MADLNLNQVMRPLKISDYLEPYKTNGMVSGNYNLDISGYNIHQLQVTGALNLTFSGWHPSPGFFQTVILYVINEGHVVSWPGSVHNGPEINSPKRYIVVLTTPNQGTDIIASLYGSFT